MPPHPGQMCASSGNKDNFLTHSLHSEFGCVLSLLPHPGHGSGRHIFCRYRRISIYQRPGRPRGQSCGQIIGFRIGLPAPLLSPRVKLRFLLFTLLSSRSKRFAVRAPASRRLCAADSRAADRPCVQQHVSIPGVQHPVRCDRRMDHAMMTPGCRGRRELSFTSSPRQPKSARASRRRSHDRALHALTYPRRASRPSSCLVSSAGSLAPNLA